ncbi:uncharacterized protein LOC110237133 isoform X1 [Exaiptasia diaphana]|uniref:Uncharacterized protein n=1 Tax=Exaiptasia diaphana TaxID=2652724 RepID=A0A913X3I9_EXADI|nr:uncharacterized protein LOC110237133 isoform X1 [Exaiptasia diaphana]
MLKILAASFLCFVVLSQAWPVPRSVSLSGADALKKTIRHSGSIKIKKLGFRWTYPDEQKIECIDGTKTLKALCRSTSVVNGPPSYQDKKYTSEVPGKYCHGSRPQSKTVNC